MVMFYSYISLPEGNLDFCIFDLNRLQTPGEFPIKKKNSDSFFILDLVPDMLDITVFGTCPKTTNFVRRTLAGDKFFIEVKHHLLAAAPQVQIWLIQAAVRG